MTLLAKPYLQRIQLRRETVDSFEVYPFSIPAVRRLDSLDFHPDVTFLVGENGAGKSTLLEAIAVALGFNPEGGNRNTTFSTHDNHSGLARHLRTVRSYKKPRDGFFLRAESLYNLATYMEQDGRAEYLSSYGGLSLHAQSHGESFMATLLNKFKGDGLYLLDEPEAALSPTRQLAALRAIHQLVDRRSQFVIATHSPILLAYPGARIYQFSADGIEQVAYRDTEHYTVTRRFLNDPEGALEALFGEE